MTASTPAGRGARTLRITAAVASRAAAASSFLGKRSDDPPPVGEESGDALRSGARLYLLVIASVALALVAVAIGALPSTPPDALALAIALAIATALVSYCPLPLANGSKLVLDTAPLVAAVLLFDFRVALIVAGVGTGIALLLRRSAPDEIAFNVAVAVLHSGSGGAILAGLGWEPASLLRDTPMSMLFAFSVGTGMWLLGSFLVAPMVALQTGGRVVPSWWSMVTGAGRIDILLDFAQVGIGVVVAEVAVAHRWQVAVLLLPTGALYQALSFHVRLRRQAEERLKHQAFHDSLTDLPNRAAFLERLGQALERPAPNGRRIALLFVDLDRFKFVNDSLGHVVGDELLVQLSYRLREAVRPEDFVARFGGDEFTVLLQDVRDEESATMVARRIIAALDDPFSIEGHASTVSASVGIALTSPGTVGAADMLRDADVALYRAKRQGKARFAVYDADVDHTARHKIALEVELRRALAGDELRLAFQPQVDLATGRIAGVEALVRWAHPTGRLLPPDAFIPVAEESALILSIGRWVLAEACRQARSWSDRFPHAPAVSVNLSARQFQHAGLIDDVAAALRDSGLDPSGLKLEITESAMLADEDNAATLTRLKELGVRIAIDDFGTGYSSLDYLRRFRVDELKIDRAFVAGLGRDGGDTTIVRAVVGLAHALGLAVVAEGIETGAQVARLRNLGCELGQGYFFQRPLPADEVAALLRAQTPDAVTGDGVLVVTADTTTSAESIGAR